MPTPSQFFLNFILPALAAGGLLLAAWITPRRKTANGRWMGALAVSVGFAIADCGIGGMPRWPPGTGDASYWLIWFAAPIALLGALDASTRPPNWARAGAIFILARLGGAVLISPLVLHGGAEAAGQIWWMGIWLDGIAAITVVWWMGLEELAERNPGATVPVILMLTFASAAAVLGIANDIKPSQLMVALTGTAVAAAGLAWPIKLIAWDRGAVLAWTIPLLGTLAVVHFYYYTEPPVAGVMLLLVAPLLAFGGEIPAVRRMGRVSRSAVRLAPLLLALAAAVGLTVLQSRQAAAETPKNAIAPSDL